MIRVRFSSLLYSQLNFFRQALTREFLRSQTRQSLDSARGQFSRCTVFIVGNGPSLTQDQIDLASQYQFIALNRAYQLFGAQCFERGAAGYLMINDFYRCLEVLPNLSHQFQQVVIGCHNPNFVYYFPSLLRPHWIFANCAWGFRLTRRGFRFEDLTSIQEFSADFLRYYFPGWSVLFSAIQFAVFLGASRIVLLGCDMDYSGPIEYTPLVANDRFSLGHLCNFDYSIHGRPHMLACRNGLARLGIDILNAAPAGAIQEIPRVSMDQLRNLLQSHNG